MKRIDLVIGFLVEQFDEELLTRFLSYMKDKGVTKNKRHRTVDGLRRLIESGSEEYFSYADYGGIIGKYLIEQQNDKNDDLDGPDIAIDDNIMFFLENVEYKEIGPKQS